ncbi:MAG: hypothetical protein CVU13_04705 [Bacteroidetes bacterium HGW-Bacteroidetes-8]|jgi:hypothetical protein|nr:MAG: hypothetical protein CVU13_04705 [Bacteroidetes bacterium HGW-Bacteroidetes-8]
MKKLYIIIGLLSLMFYSCKKELGTYDRLDVNKVIIDTILTRTIQLGDTLRIIPEIAQTLEKSEDNLEYSWYWYKFGFTEVDTLSKERNLNYKIPISTSLGSYTTICKVTDKKTGLFGKWMFTVNVAAANAEGVLVLSNLDGNAELGLLNLMKNYIGGLYYEANGSHPGQNPVSVGFTKVNAVPYLNSIIIMCDDEKGGVVTNHMDFIKMYDYKKYFFVAPSVIKPQRYYNGISGLDARYDFIINNNRLHVREYRNAQKTEEKTFFKPELMPTSSEISPYAIADPFALLFYDNTNMKFVRVGVQSLQYLSTAFLPIAIGTQNPATMPFDPNNVGLKLVNMDIGWKKLGFGIFKDPATGQLYRLHFSFASMAFNASMSAYYKKPITDAPNLESATSYVYSILDPYLYYSKDNLLYRYDLEFDKTQAIYNLDTVIANSKIDKLYMRYYAGQTTHSGTLYLGSSEQGKSGKNGSLHVLKLDRSGTVSDVDTVYRNISGRIVSMDYKF